MAADSNTETAPAASDSTGPDKGSGGEFSRPSGAEDGAIWEKHFGKGSKESTQSRSSPKSESDGKPAADKLKTSGNGKSASGKSSEQSKGKADQESSRTTDSSSSKPPTTSKESTSKDSEAKADDKPEKDDAPADPEAPLKKARDLYKQAQKTEDRREARKLYKRAMVEAFGEVPQEFDDKRYAAVRTERAAAQKALDEQAQKNERRISEAADKLKPAIYVMRQLEGSGLGNLSVPLVEQAVHVMKAIRAIEDGDFTQLAEVVSRAARVDHDEAMRRFVKGVKMSPEGKAARQAAEQAQRDNAALKERLAQLERQLTERETQQTEAQKKQERARQVEESRTRYLDDIREELGDHPVLQLPRGAERVMAYQIRHADRKLKSARYSHLQVANRILEGEKERLRASRRLLDEGSGGTERQPETPRRSNGSVSRTETVDSGVRVESPEAAFERIYEKNRAAGGRRVR